MAVFGQMNQMAPAGSAAWMLGGQRPVAAVGAPGQDANGDDQEMRQRILAQMGVMTPPVMAAQNQGQAAAQQAVPLVQAGAFNGAPSPQALANASAQASFNRQAQTPVAAPAMPPRGPVGGGAPPAAPAQPAAFNRPAPAAPPQPRAPLARNVLGFRMHAPSPVTVPQIKPPPTLAQRVAGDHPPQGPQI